MSKPPPEKPTVVLFRKYPTKDGEVLALFPEVPHSFLGAACTCYAHFGQHGSADPWLVIRSTRPATSEESAPLQAELERVGYSLRPVLRITRKMHNARIEAARRKIAGWKLACQ